MKDLQLNAPELETLEVSKADSIRNTFIPMSNMLSLLEDEYNEIVQESEVEITDSLSDLAKDLRIRIAKVRITTEKTRVDQKAEYLRAGKAIDGVANILKWAVTEKEEKLKDIELFFEKRKQQRLTDLQYARWDELQKYLPENSYEKDLSGMDEDVWFAYLKQKKQDHLDFIEAEKQSELDRIAKVKAEADERKRMLEENSKLKAEREAIEKKAKEELKERNKLESERLAKEAKAETERKETEQKERNERARLQHIADAKHELALKIEREKIAKLEAERLANQKALEEAEQAKEAAKEAELNKGDADKVQDLLNDLKALKTKYAFKSAKNTKMYNNVGTLIDKVINFIS